MATPYTSKHHRVYHQLTALVQQGDVAAVRKFLQDRGPDLRGPPVDRPLNDSVATAFDYACLMGHTELAMMLHEQRPGEYSGYAHLWFSVPHHHHVTNELCPRPVEIANLLASLPTRYGTEALGADRGTGSFRSLAP